MSDLKEKFSPNQIQQCIETLRKLVQDNSKLAEISPEQKLELFKAAGQLSRPSRDEFRIRNKSLGKIYKKKVAKKDREARAETGIRRARETSVFVAPLQLTSSHRENTELKSPRNCYVCKAEFTKLHFFYDSMCMSCAELNYQKRFQTASLQGKVALITGSRLKIGYHSTL